MKKYLACTITTKSGNKFDNPLQLKEAYLISKMAQENEKVEVKFIECSKEQYKQLFG